MSKKLKAKANNIVWVEYWINQVNPSSEKYEINAEQLDNGKWICEIELPLVGKTVNTFSETEINAVLDAADIASKYIGEYMSENADQVIENPYIGEDLVIESDENGEIIFVGPSYEHRQELDKLFESFTNKLITAASDAMKELPKKYRSNMGVVVKILDKSLFGNDLSENELAFKARKYLNKDTDVKDQIVCYDNASESVIIIGYTHKNN